jgi:pimeloyl-ACP methyl ester carboxylesterase
MGGALYQAIVRKIASQDYLNAGVMRPTLVRLVQEDFTTIAPNVHVPTLMLWGLQDQETPPWMGREFQRLMPQSKLIELPAFDHTSLLTTGRFQVAHHILAYFKQDHTLGGPG